MNRRKDYLTFIGVVSAVAVLTLHTNGCFWSFSATERYWKSANIIESVFYFAVPLFYIISSVTLIDYQERYSLKEYFVKRINKAVIPFIAWSLIGMLYQIFRGNIAWNELSPGFIYQGIVDARFVSIFRFFGSLFSIYLCMPLFAAVEKNKRREVFSYLAAGGFVLNILLPFLCTVFGSDISLPYSIQVVSDALYWIPLGWLLENTEFRKKERYLIYCIALAGLLIHIVGTYVFSMRAGEVVRTFKGYTGLPCILYSAGVFVLLKQIGSRIMAGKFARFVNWAGRYTFPIYLMQVFLLSEIPRLPFVHVTSLLYRLGGPFVMIPIIILVTACLRKIPIVRRIVP